MNVILKINVDIILVKKKYIDDDSFLNNLWFRMHRNLFELVFRWLCTCLTYLAAQKEPGSLPKF